VTCRCDGRTGAGRHGNDAGFSLAEVLVATCLLATGLVAVAALSFLATDATTEARRMTVSVALACQKLEQLRALAWSYDTLGLPVTDETSDLSVSPAAPAGGRGLLPSPFGTLTSDVPGYVDYLDAAGTWLGSGTSPLPGTVYIRRWAIEPDPGDPMNVVLFEVTVRFAGRGASGLPGASAGSPFDVFLAGAKGRKRG
jgi:type II secretory pathway pseudopilin PulG